MQLTAKGLTKELGYVGSYGEVLDWVGQIYDATRPAPGAPGDPKIREQFVKIALARAPFRRPALDEDGNRAMRLESVIGWRDLVFPGIVLYGQKESRDASSLQAAAATLDPRLVGYAQQSFADNQFFATVATKMEEDMFRVTSGLLETPGEYELIKSQPSSPHKLPMTAGSRRLRLHRRGGRRRRAQARRRRPLRLALLACPPRGQLPRPRALLHADGRSRSRPCGRT